MFPIQEAEGGTLVPKRAKIVAGVFDRDIDLDVVGLDTTSYSNSAGIQIGRAKVTQ